MPFNPKAYALRSDEVVTNYEARKKWREENAHLALPFFVEGLRDKIPPIFPQEMAVIGAPSGDGKTNIMKLWHAQAQKAVAESKNRAVTIFGSQEETTERLLAGDIEKRGASAAASRPTVWIGTSFGMDAEQMEDRRCAGCLATARPVRDLGRGGLRHLRPVRAGRSGRREPDQSGDRQRHGYAGGAARRLRRLRPAQADYRYSPEPGGRVQRRGSFHPPDRRAQPGLSRLLMSGCRSRAQ